MWWMLGVVATVAAAEGPVRLTRPEPPEVDLAAAAEELRLEAIARLEPLVVAATGDERAERALRLASLLADEARVLRMRELAAGGDPRPDGSLRWTDRSIRVARAIVDQHPRWERWDEAATLLASTLEEAGKAAEADEAWVALVRARPASRHATDAWIAIGQRALDTSDAGRAVAALEHAARDTEHPRHAWALYALAWARYGAGDVDGGIVALRRVIANTANAPEGALRMDQEAIGDLPRFYADADRVDEGIEVLTGLGRADLADAALARLASALDEQGRPSEAAAVYRRLLVASPEAPDAPRWTASLAGALVADGRPSEALDVFTDALADQAWDELEAPLLRQALAWHEASRQHRRGRADDTEALAGLADRAYALWMRAFPASEEAVEVRYAAAELAWELGRIREARDGYAAVFEADPMGPHARFCAESAVFASRKLVGPIERLTPGPLTEADRLLLADDERLIALDLHRVEATWETAYLLYHRGELDRAAERFAEVVALDPRSRDAEVAAHLILDALATQERWATLAQTASA
ncbi:MAG: tetratricopeptide repeat protein, partial [Alphaproteobacteria bacterium]|nr:tetratricopeptide repeat protein [Alphaproteobacteria bacterium]